MPANAVVIDTNLLVLLIVGIASPSYIARHKRLQAYTRQDFLLLTDFLSRARRVVVTPNTVTETSNLARQIAEPARSHIHRVLHAFLQTSEEVYVASKTAANHASFVRLGVADAALLDMIGEDHMLLTADLDLYLEALGAGRETVNFNHYIEANRP